MVYSNIFTPRNDWGVKSLQCKQNIHASPFHCQVAKIIKDVWKTDPLTLKVYRGTDDVIARQLFAVMMRKHTKESLRRVGNYIGKTHGTIISSIKSISNLCDTNKLFREKYNKIDILVSQLTNK